MTISFDKYFKYCDYKINWDYVDKIPEFQKLKECEQNPVWHAEGNAYIHTRKAVEAAEKLILDERFRDLDVKIAMMAVLFHDIGKGVTTEFKNGAWHAYGHEAAGEKIARRILWDSPLHERELICSCIRNHMRILRFADSKNILKDMVAASDEFAFRWDYQLFVKMCDNMACKMQDQNEYDKDMAKLEALYDIANELDILSHRFIVKTNAATQMIYGNRKFDWLQPMRDERPIMYVLIGLPGAGKSTWCEKTKLDTVSRDAIRAELGYCNEGDKVVLSPEQEDEVTKVFNERLVKLLSEKKNVIVDNLNLKKKYRAALKEVVKGLNVRVTYVYMESPSLDTNLKRRPTFEIGVIGKMTEILDWPSRDEYDELWIYKAIQA